MANFRAPLVLLAILFVLSSATLMIGVANLVWMRASSSTPWGVVTAIVVHTDFGHYAGNMVGLWAFVPLFVAINLGLDCARQRRRSLMFAATILVAAVAANAAWVLRVPTVSPAQGVIGASGVVFAAMGAIAMFALFNSLDDATAFWHGRKGGRPVRSRPLLLTLANLAVFLVIFAAVMVSPGGFLGVGAGVNVLSHGIAVILAVALSSAYRLWWEPRPPGAREPLRSR